MGKQKLLLFWEVEHQNSRKNSLIFWTLLSSGIKNIKVHTVGLGDDTFWKLGFFN